MVQYFQDIYQAVSSALVGMSITIKHIWKKPVTLQYPDERQVMSDRFRGFVHNDMNVCDACLQCAKACPVDCIYIVTEGKAKDRYMTRYAIDYNKCIWCSLCTEVCPTDSITMSHDYDHSVYFRNSLVYEFVDPAVQPIPCHKEVRKALGFIVAEKKKPERPAKKKDAKPAAEKPAAEKPAAEKPVAEEPAAEKPAEAPAAEKPAKAAPAPAPEAPAEETPAPAPAPAPEAVKTDEPAAAPAADTPPAKDEPAADEPVDDKGETK